MKLNRNKRDQRLRRAKALRFRISRQKKVRLVVHRSLSHIYASLIALEGDRVLTGVSTVQADIRRSLAQKGTGNKNAAAVVGAAIAERAKKLGISQVVFDRSGYPYHGRVRALAEAAREQGLQF